MPRDPIVFLPDVMCDARLFAPQMFALAPEHVVITAPLTRGERIEEVASSLLDHLPSHFALCGQGLGGIVALDLIKRAPDRVSRVAFVATDALPDTPQDAAAREDWIVGARSGRLGDVMASAVPQGAIAPGPQAGDVRALVDDMADFLGTDVFVRQMRMLQRRRDMQAAMRRCKAPAWMIAGSEDPLVPVKRMEFLAEFTPFSELKVIDGAGHFPSLETPDALTQVLSEWLRAPLVLS
ncbi:alpha/beta fold hydrolase [Pseudaestuariivita sp.]|uniref:alpha/beta fold hydrolase n=1 Tax=Pseudaestuariivita sp. TaxID=2211669 RepID=UPI004058712D